MKERHILSWEEISGDLNARPLSLSMFALNTIAYHHIDAISKCQLYSKSVIADHIINTSIVGSAPENILICGGWIGIQASILYSHRELLDTKITSADLDQSFNDLAKQIVFSDNFDAITEDVYNIDYSSYDLVINTISEHLSDISRWFKLLPRGTQVVVSNTDFTDPPDHVSTYDSDTEFYELCDQYLDLTRTLTLDFPIYDRYLAFGTKR